MTFNSTFKYGMKTKIAFMLGLVAAAPFTAQATIVSGYGASAATSTASNCPSYCTTAGGGDFQYDSDGGEFSTSANSSENSYASAAAAANLNGSTYLPTLQVSTSADVGKGAGASAFAIQGYTYNGADTTVSLDINLHGSVADNANGSYAYNAISGSVAVLFGSALDYYDDYGTLVYEIAWDLPRVEATGLFVTGLNSNSFDTLTFDLTDGTDFFVVSQLDANSNNGYADGWNTLTMAFDDDTGLTAASVSAVPVPAAVWLFGSGLVGLIGFARPRKG